MAGLFDVLAIQGVAFPAVSFPYERRLLTGMIQDRKAMLGTINDRGVLAGNVRDLAGILWEI